MMITHLLDAIVATIGRWRHCVTPSWLLVAAAAANAASPPPAPPTTDVAAVYARECAACHGSDRLGGTGPALLPENLGRLKQTAAAAVIASGRPASQMPAFAQKLDAATIAALAAFIYTPPATPPVWDAAQIVASHIVYGHTPNASPPTDVADPLNMFVVVETGDHHVTILDGDRLEPLARVPTRFALHGGPKFSPDGRFVTFASRDGWISRFDLYTRRYVAEIRAGINTRNIAASHDGRYILVGNYLPQTLVVLDAHDLSLVQVFPARTVDGRTSRVSAVYQAAPRNSFVVALKDLPEILELPLHGTQPNGGHAMYSYGPLTEPMRRAAQMSEIRHIHVGEVLDDFFFTPDYRHVIGAARDGDRAVVVDLDAGKVIATLPLQGLPHLGSGISWPWQGTTLVATPNLKRGAVTFIDTADWRIVRELETLGPGFFMRSHEQSPYAWVDVFFGPHKDALHVIDKQSLQIVATLRPEPGKTAAHVEFDRHGRYALVSLWEDDGAVIAYDAKTLKEIKRLPMKKPSGKYNVYNKTRLSDGTSH